MEIKIDLNNHTNKKDIPQKLGEALGYKDKDIWGENWDAFNDILGYLDTGGIYGTNKIISDPITLLIKNFHEFKYQKPEDYYILVNILKENKKENPDFNYKFIEPILK